jgi:hypothetical protein
VVQPNGDQLTINDLRASIPSSKASLQKVDRLILSEGNTCALANFWLTEADGLTTTHCSAFLQAKSPNKWHIVHIHKSIPKPM